MNLKKWLLIIGVTVGLFIVWLCIDEPLDDNAKAWLEEAQSTQPNDAYFLFLGLTAPSNANPIEVGKKIHTQALALTNDNSDISPRSDELNDSSEKLKCKNDINFCILQLSTMAKNYRISTAQHILLARYQQLLKSPEIHAPIYTNSFIPQYKFIIHAQRVNIIQHLQLAPKQPKIEIDAALYELKQLRIIYQHATTLLFKMIATRMLMDQLDTIALLKQQYPTIPINKLQLLSPTEHNLEKVMAGEFYFGKNIIEQAYASGTIKWYEKIYFNSLWYKKNMSINQQYNQRQYIVKAYSESPAVISQYVINNKDIPPISKIQVKNFIGNILNAVSISHYRDSFFRMIGLNTKIILANELSLSNVNFKQIPNPYYPKETAIIEKDRACFTGPMTVYNKFERCIPLVENKHKLLNSRM